MSRIRFKVVKLTSGETFTHDFGRTILEASVAIQGFKCRYEDNDKWIRSVEAKASISSVSGSQVTVSCFSEMEDDNDNLATGEVEILIIADCDT